MLDMVNEVFVLFLSADKKHWYCVTIILLMIGTEARESLTRRVQPYSC